MIRSASVAAFFPELRAEDLAADLARVQARRAGLERIVQEGLGVAVRGEWFRFWTEYAGVFSCTPSPRSDLRLEDVGEGWWAFATTIAGRTNVGQIHESRLAAWLRIQFRTKPEKAWI